MVKGIREYIRKCELCAKRKVVELESDPTPRSRMAIYGYGLVGPIDPIGTRKSYVHSHSCWGIRGVFELVAIWFLLLIVEEGILLVAYLL
jgi:hypothetical protein